MTISPHENAAALFAAAFIQSGHAGDEVRAAERYYAALEALEAEQENRERGKSSADPPQLGLRSTIRKPR